MSERWHKVCISVLVIVWFCYGGTKLLSVETFAITLYINGVIPIAIASFCAAYVPILEVAIAVGLCVKVIRFATLWVSLVVLCGFTVVLAGVYIKVGPDADCGCTGLWMGQGLHFSFLRNACLLSLTAWGVRSERRQQFGGLGRPS